MEASISPAASETSPRFGMITMSYWKDLERCRLLVESVRRFVDPPVTHYLVVDRRDVPLFREFEGPHTKVVTVESVVPWWIFRVPFAKRWWLSLKTMPVRNWILQQITKIGMAKHVSDDVLIYVDSDVTFVRRFDPRTLVQDGKVRLFSVPGGANFGEHLLWHATAGRLLGLPPQNYYGAAHIGNIITWRRENVLRLYEHLERQSGRRWVETICAQWNLSEYILYGVFCEQVLKEMSGHFSDPRKLTHEYWTAKPWTDAELEEFFSRIQPYQVAVMVTAKAGMPISRYEKHLLSVPPV